MAPRPGGVHALQRAPQRRRVHVAPRGDPNTMGPAAAPRSSIAASETFGYQPGPTYGNRFRQDCLASHSPPQSPGPAARRPRAQRRPPGTGWAGGRGRCACSAPRPRRRTCCPLRTCAPQKLRAYSMTPGPRGSPNSCCALPQRLLAVAVAAQRLQNLHTARKGLPHRHHVVQLAGARHPQPHSAHLPSCARVFSAA